MQSDEFQAKSWLRKICFVSAGYPYNDDYSYPFVKQLVDAIADLGYSCEVIVPQSISKNILNHKGKRPLHWKYETAAKHTVNVHQPSFVSFSNLKIKNMSISAVLSAMAVRRAFRAITDDVEVIYGHFWGSGMCAAYITQSKPIPLFIASGESVVSVHKNYPQKCIDYLKRRSTGVICVSTKNLQESTSLGLIEKSPAIVIPNGVDKKKFYPRDKQEIRKKLDIEEDAFVVAFVGAFIERKGVERLSNAIKISGRKIHSFFIGKGGLHPDCPGILHCGPLPHDLVPEYLSAADVFVLPTLAEGCSNAIVEAMACGLPIISSNLPFNDDILTDENAIRVDPNNVEEIAAAIQKLQSNQLLRKRMSEASLRLAQTMDIQTRAKRIIGFMESCIQQKKGIE